MEKGQQLSFIRSGKQFHQHVSEFFGDAVPHVEITVRGYQGDWFKTLSFEQAEVIRMALLANEIEFKEEAAYSEGKKVFEFKVQKGLTFRFEYNEQPSDKKARLQHKLAQLQKELAEFEGETNEPSRT